MAWFELLNQAVRFYNEGNDSECIALLTNIMRSLLPSYAKIRCHTLMAYALDDWYEAEVSRVSTASSTVHNVERADAIIVDAL
jgi:hypothetical protein